MPVVPTVIAALVTEPEEAGSSHWYTDRKFTISITAFLLILPLSIPKEIGFQKYARWVGRALRGWELGGPQLSTVPGDEEWKRCGSSTVSARLPLRGWTSPSLPSRASVSPSGK